MMINSRLFFFVIFVFLVDGVFSQAVIPKRGTISVRKIKLTETSLVRSQNFLAVPPRLNVSDWPEGDKNQMNLTGDWRISGKMLGQCKYFSRLKFTDQKVYLYNENDQAIDSGNFSSFLDDDREKEQYDISTEGYSGGKTFGNVKIYTPKTELKNIKCELEEKNYLGKRPEYRLKLSFPEFPNKQIIFYPYGKEYLFGKWSTSQVETLSELEMQIPTIKILGDSVYFMDAKNNILDKGTYFATKDDFEQYILGILPYSGYKQQGTINFLMADKSIENINYELEEKKIMGESVRYKLILLMPENNKRIIYNL